MKRAALLVMILLLTACGQAGTEERTSVDSSFVQEPQSETFDWQGEMWNADLKEGPAYTLYLRQYIDDLEADAAHNLYEKQNTFYSVWGKHIYALDCFGMTLQDGGSTQLSYCLNHYEEGAEEIRHQEFQLPDLPGAVGLYKNVVAFDIVNEEECVLFVQVKRDEQLEKYVAIHISADGEVQRMTDLYPAMAENGIIGQEGYVFDKIYTDAQGNYYLISDGRQGEILVLGEDGAVQAHVETGGSEVQLSMKDPNGAPVFEWYDPGEELLHLVGYDLTSGIKTLASVKLPPFTPKVLSEEGFLYYLDVDSKLYRWELGTGEVAYCMDGEAMGLSTNPALVRISASSDGKPLLLSHAGGNAYIYLLDTEQASSKVMLRLVSTMPYCDYVSDCAAHFSRQQEKSVLLVDKPEIEGITAAEEITRIQNEFRERALLELTSGESADLYLVSAADMRMLYKKGALADLTGVLPSELENCIFPGVLESGVIEGRQIGLAPQAAATVAMVSNELWTGDSWTYEEALDLWDSRPGLEYLLVSPGYNYGTGYLYQTFLRDLARSPFLDLEKGTCNFTDPLFIRILEHMQDYRGSGRWEENPLEEGKAAGFFVTLVSYPYFTQLMAQYGEQYHPVGFPTQEGAGNYWNGDYYLVMSKDSPNREIVQEYLLSLFDPEQQRDSDHPVRNDLISRYTVYNDTGQGPKLQYDMGDGVFSVLETKKDGSSWEEEYLALMNDCSYCSEDTGEILEIIKEEAEYCFYGGRDVWKTAEIIQNRVQTYMNEHSD